MMSKILENVIKVEKKDKKKNYFKYYQICILLLAFAILLFQVIAHITLTISIAHIDSKNDALLRLKSYYGIFNNMFTTTMSLACLAGSPKDTNCVSIINFFEKGILKREGIPLSAFLSGQNRGTINPLINVRGQILEILSNSNDKILNSLINSGLTTIMISQNITKDGVQLMAKKQNDSFIDVLNYMTGSFIVLTSNDTYLNDVIYILNKVDYDADWTSSEEPFKYVKSNELLTNTKFDFII